MWPTKKSKAITSTHILIWALIFLAILLMAASSLLYLNGSDPVWGFAWLVFVMLSILIFSFFFILGLRVAQRDGYLDGFTAGKNHARKSGKKLK